MRQWHGYIRSADVNRVWSCHAMAKGVANCSLAGRGCRSVEHRQSAVNSSQLAMSNSAHAIKQQGTYSYDGGALADCSFKVVAHAHGKFR